MTAAEIATPARATAKPLNDLDAPGQTDQTAQPTAPDAPQGAQERNNAMIKTCRKFPTVAARRMQAVELLARGLDRDAVCRKLKISPRTLRNYLADPAVQTALAQAQGERLDGLRRQSLDGAGKALTVLARVMNNTKTPPAARVSAASSMTATAVKLAGPALVDIRLRDERETPQANAVQSIHDLIVKVPILTLMDGTKISTADAIEAIGMAQATLNLPQQPPPPPETATAPAP